MMLTVGLAGSALLRMKLQAPARRGFGPWRGPYNWVHRISLANTVIG